MRKTNVIGYGELLLRLTPIEHGSLLEQSDALRMGFAGAEANILCDLSVLGHYTSFISAFPNNPIGKKAQQFMRQYGVDTKAIQWDENRLGTYFIEHGHSIRGTRVSYDRKNSSVTKFSIPEKFWNTIFSDAKYFVLTGVSPALSVTMRKNIEIALKVAKRKKIKVLFDLNYRRTLWSTKKARAAFDSILPYVDILIANTGSVSDVYGHPWIAVDDFDALRKQTVAATDLLSKLGKFEMIAMTMRLQKNASENILGGLIKVGGKYSFSKEVPVSIVDRIGGGDAFAAGILHGLIKKWSPKKTVNFASAAFALTQTIKGDINYFDESEILEIANGNTQGFVKR